MISKTRLIDHPLKQADCIKKRKRGSILKNEFSIDSLAKAEGKFSMLNQA